MPPSDRFVVPEIREISPPAGFYGSYKAAGSIEREFEVEMIKLCYFGRFFGKGGIYHDPAFFGGKTFKRVPLAVVS